MFPKVFVVCDLIVNRLIVALVSGLKRLIEPVAVFRVNPFSHVVVCEGPHDNDCRPIRLDLQRPDGFLPKSLL